jgi:hypothetical protein
MPAIGVKMARSQTLDPVERDIRMQNIAYLVRVSLEAYDTNPLQAKEIEHGKTHPSRP